MEGEFLEGELFRGPLLLQTIGAKDSPKNLGLENLFPRIQPQSRQSQRSVTCAQNVTPSEENEAQKQATEVALLGVAMPADSCCEKNVCICAWKHSEKFGKALVRKTFRPHPQYSCDFPDETPEKF